ncbi:hypothetical protein PybrP1_005089 [[Pythium] brassicae (nom. inval.)]|nr:hypothetical protein PybrP1_005089 [[Pythium] brassicae (nom. inval.)]
MTEEDQQAPRSATRNQDELEALGECVTDDEEHDDPMAWADLEAFGGTKKTLERPPPRRKLTPEQVRAQLDDLDALERRMHEAQRATHPKTGLVDTIAWLKKHNDAVEAAGANQKLKRSSSFVRSVLGFFSPSGSHRSPPASEETRDARPPRSNNDVERSQRSNNVVDGECDAFPRLCAPWGQAELQCDWTALGFALLNEALLHDLARVRAVIAAGGLDSASPQAIVAVAKWLTLFDQHVHDVITLKEYLLDERAALAGVGYKVSTTYDAYNEALAAALARVHDERRFLGEAIERVFCELEAVLRDERAAVAAVLAPSLTEPQEYDALSSLFHHLSDEEGCGVIVAKLLGWMQRAMAATDVQAFLALFDPDMQDKVAGEWMRQYASYLHLLDEFALQAETPMTFFT